VDLRALIRDMPDFPIAARAFLVELSFLGGRARLSPHAVQALIQYES
jgi:hypothetical protein